MKAISLLRALALAIVIVQPLSAQSRISADNLRRRLFTLADDSMMGRESGLEGAYKASQYVAGEFKRIGLEPAGEGGSYFQTVPLWLAAIDPKSQLTVGGRTLSVYRDFIPTNVVAPSRSLDNMSVIYAGSMSDTSRILSGPAVAGKIAVLDIPPGIAMRQVGPVAFRLRDASVVALVALDLVGPETVARLREGRPLADTTRNRNSITQLIISRDAARALLGADPATLAPGAQGQAVSGHFDIPRRPVPFTARNVVGILRGSDPQLRGQYLSLTAHHDHVGFDHAPVDHDSLRAFNRVVRPMGADSPLRPATPDEAAQIRVILDSLRKANRPRLDSIRNGADDDGTGTVSILEIAETMARGPRPRRSILFVSHTAEEAGLLGSRWYSDHATVPLDSVVAEIDQDMVGRGTSSDFPRGGTGAGSPTYLEVIGAKRLSREFGEALEAANARQVVPFSFDYTYDTPGHPLQYYCRADHYSYARYGIPSVALSRGEHLDYHQVTDESQYISYNDLARVAQLVYDAAMSIANAPSRPKLDAPKQTDPNAPCRQ